MGANIIKSKWRFYGAYYLLREEGFVPEVNDFLRPEVHAYYTLFNVNNWTTTLSGGYFPEHNGQDEFGQLAGELVYFKTFTSKAGALSLRWDNDVTTHLNHEKVYESPDKTIKRTADTPAYLLATSLEASFVPAKVKGLTLFAGVFAEKMYEDSYVFKELAIPSGKGATLDSQSKFYTFDKSSRMADRWTANYARVGLNYQLTKHLSINEQVRCFMSEGFRGLAEGQVLQNRFYITYAY